MIRLESKKKSITGSLILLVLTFQILSCAGQVKEKTADTLEKVNETPLKTENTNFPI